MTEQTFNPAVSLVLLCFIVALIGVCVFKAVQIAWRYYRDCKPRSMATPWRDPRDAQREFKERMQRELRS